MQNSIKFLSQIQRIDLEINALKEEEKRSLIEIGSLGADILKGEEEAAAITVEMEAIKTSEREVDVRIAHSVEKVSRDEKRINDIKNDRELSALTKEIAAANKVKKLCEGEKEAFTSRYTEKNEKLSAVKAAIQDKTARLAAVTADMEDKKSEWGNILARKTEERDGLKVNIRPDVLKRYEAVKEKRGGIGMALIRDETCQGCYINIPPQVYILLRRGVDELQSCPHCHRILYVEHPDEVSPV